jgi:protease-4
MDLLNEFFKCGWAILPKVAESYRHNIRNLMNGKPFFDQITTQKKIQFTSQRLPGNPVLDNNGKVAIIPVSGPLMKNSGFFNTGTLELAQLLKTIDDDDEFCGSVLMMDSPGGSTSSVSPMIEVLKSKTKPVITYVDDMAASAAYFIASYTDEIWASNPMAEVGSIGIMAMFMNDKKAYENQGIEIIEVYPPESNYKNKPINDAMDGDTRALIEEQLSPWAVYFQDAVKKNRKKLDLSVEGLLNGKMFFATDAVKNGLINKIGSLEQVVNRVILKSKKPI